jgi:hypothetical protein
VERELLIASVESEMCLGMNQQAPASDLGAELRRPADGVGEETCAEPATFVPDRHPETSQQRHRLWMRPAPLRTRVGASSMEMLAIDQA